MITRRQAAAGLITLPLSSYVAPVVALDANSADTPNTDAPQEVGEADFAAEWTPLEGETIEAVAAPPDIDRKYIDQFSRVSLTSSSDIDQAFISHTTNALPFVQWFNRTLAAQDVWAGKRIQGNNVENNFSIFWNHYLSETPITLMTFICYMAVFINECDGDLVYKSERFSNRDHPGITYLFDEFPMYYAKTKHIWNKKSYNSASLNKVAGDLFNDPIFISAHGKFAAADQVLHTNDEAWWGHRYRREMYPYSGVPADCGCILEADFFKFRGRGLIQTTWRVNYKRLVGFISTYNGTDATILRFKEKWRGLDADTVCTTSCNADWDVIFSQPNQITLCQAIRIHAADGRYLPLSDDYDVINSSNQSSIEYMGNRIGGGSYGLLLKGRVQRICSAMVV